MNARSSPIPLRPDPGRLAADASRSLARAAIAASRGALDRSVTATGFINKTWPEDRAAALFTRAAVDPLPLTPGGPLAQIAFHFVASLVGVSAAASVIARSLALTWNGAAQISIPALRLPHAAFVAQGAPIASIVGLSSAGLVMAPYKIGTIVELTGEMIRYTAGEQMVEQVLRENIGPTLDSLLLSNAAGVSGQQPPGLLYGITALTPSTTGANKFDDMVSDLQTLAAAVAPVASGSIAFVCAVPQALAIQLRAENLTYPVLPSTALPSGTVICIGLPALATAVDAPTIEASATTVVHEADPASPLVDIGGVWAAPLRSMFQSDSVAVRFLMQVSWGLCSPQGVAFMQGVSW